MKIRFLRYIVASVVLAGLVAGGYWLWHTGRVQYVLALTGDPVRQYEYGRWLVVHKRDPEALMWMEKAAEYEPRAMVWIAMAANWQPEYFTYPVPKDAFWYLKEAADRKNVVAMVLLAGMYEDSKYVRSQKDMTPDMANKAALVWYMRSASEGAGLSIDRMVKVYENGELGEEKDRDKAEEWRKMTRKPDEYWKKQF